jgi:hypothetical protein
MTEEQVPWSMRWIVDENRRDTGFAMQRRHLEDEYKVMHAEMAATHRFIGFTHYGPFPLLHVAYNGNPRGLTPRNGWQLPEVEICEAWAHCFRDPDSYLPPDKPRMLIGGSDFVNENGTWQAAHRDGRPAKKWDLIYSCLPNWLNLVQKNWDLAQLCVLRLADAGLRVLVVGRASMPGRVDHPRIDYAPQLPWAQFLRATASSRVALLPNWWDASPRVLTEALTLDVPVVVNRQILGGWKYVAEETGVFFDDESDVVEAFFSVLEAPVAPRDWFLASGYGKDATARRLAAELRALDGPPRDDLTYALPTSTRPAGK